MLPFNTTWASCRRKSCIGASSPTKLDLPLERSEHLTFRDFIVQGFGQYLADLFLIPQNEKTMAISLDRLSIGAVKRFFPPPNEALVRAGIRGGSPTAGEYNSSFWYPKTGGIGALVKGLGAGLNAVRTNQQVTAIDLSKRRLRTSTGESFAWDHLFSSMPLKSLCQITNEPALRAAATGAFSQLDGQLQHWLARSLATRI